MAAGYNDIDIDKRASYTTQITLADQYGTPFNLTGFTVKSQAKKSYYSPIIVLTFTSSIVDAANGIIELDLTANTTANLAPGKLVYDIIVTDTVTQFITRVMEGQIFVAPSVTIS